MDWRGIGYGAAILSLLWLWPASVAIGYGSTAEDVWAAARLAALGMGTGVGAGVLYQWLDGRRRQGE